MAVTNTTATTVDLSWEPVTFDGGISEYVIYRDDVEVGRSATVTFSNTGLDASTLYKYKVTAVATSGEESAKSAEVSTTTLAE